MARSISNALLHNGAEPGAHEGFGADRGATLPPTEVIRS
jgi:hypothetical protein